ncbi:cobalamin biosynthesis protein CbiX [Paenibacillus sp. FSL H8-0548]|uniref:cytochrome c biogenesis protein CcdC n=1 Tax=Paenibacillus sp. FSL H8-0548 TaxID=1920422 RepID=UPI00096D9C25|nr:cytochrome c biogenesis protein CcdC [Paenibacillus sp. FSL H8-0548]OMF21167.1 cobalamin biosynthesis protein CbiX [Paenibacillus sp. FSL H8-0548]
MKRNFYKPIRGDGRRILMPLLFMLPGVFLLLEPSVHAPLYDWLIAALLGLVLSLPLIWTTNYEVRDDNQIYAKRNIGFVFAFIVVIAIRFVLRSYLSMIEPQTLAALFMLVAFSYILPWRIVSYLKFRKQLQLRSVQNNAGEGSI